MESWGTMANCARMESWRRSWDLSFRVVLVARATDAACWTEQSMSLFVCSSVSSSAAATSSTKASQVRGSRTSMCLHMNGLAAWCHACATVNHRQQRVSKGRVTSEEGRQTHL